MAERLECMADPGMCTWKSMSFSKEPAAVQELMQHYMQNHQPTTKLRAKPKLLDKMSETEFLDAVKEVAVAPVLIGMLRMEVMGAKQQHMERFATFVS